MYTSETYYTAIYSSSCLTFKLRAEVLLRVPDFLLLLVLRERVVGAVAVLQRSFPTRRLHAVLNARILRPAQTAGRLVNRLETEIPASADI